MINLDGKYLIVALDEAGGYGYRHKLERVFIIDDLIKFINDHPDIDPHQITIEPIKAEDEL